MVRETIPRKDNDFKMWADNYSTTVKNSYKRFNIPEEVVKYNTWNHKHYIAEQPETCTGVVITEKDETRKTLEHDIRQINREYIMYSRLVTDTDHEKLGLPKYNNLCISVQLPATIPEFSFDTSMLQWENIHGQKGHWSNIESAIIP
ncbi:MAG: hypothetical protein LBV26_08430 [Bacteroidales bacterium]|jgi:hypothetical protein|nr:hypothetical protein [Bacteroidales bacterium]